MPALAAQATPPCATCRAECCGPIPVRKGELRRIVRAVAKWPEAERQRLAAQKRPPQTCPMVDKKNWRCSVYDARPTICRLYGYAEGLACPHARQLAGRVSASEARRQFAADRAVHGEVVGVLGYDIGWREIERMVTT